ncbi:MAG: response regulator [Nitrospirota bacterium]
MKNILVVEDSPTMRQLITFTVKRIADTNVIEAKDGVEALKKITSEKIDLILADINMPVMDGLKLVGLIKNNPDFKNIPVIMITTEGAKEDRERAIKIGADAYLSKPIQTQELIRMVNSFVGS